MEVILPRAAAAVKFFLESTYRPRQSTRAPFMAGLLIGGV